MDISFYHLTSSPLEKALPALLEKMVQSGKRGVLLCRDEERLSQIDNTLWTFSTKRVVPHGNHNEPYKEDQPLYLTPKEENPNGASILITVDGYDGAFKDGFERVIDMFDGDDEDALSAARSRWKSYKDVGNDKLTYWKQTDDGKWEQGA